MENVLYVILMYVLAPLFVYVTNAIMDHIRDVVLHVVDQGYLMLTIVKSVLYKRRIGMDVQRLSI